MKTFRLASAFILILAASGFLFIGCALPGCAALTATPATQPTVITGLAAVENGYALALTALNLAKQTGVISLSEFEATKPYRDSVSAALNAAETAVANKSSTAGTLIQIAEATVQSLNLHPATVKAKAATKP